MIINFASIIMMMVLMWALGRATIVMIFKAELGSGSYSHLYTIVGCIIVAVVTSFLYFRCGVSISIIAILIGLISVVVLALQIKFIKKKELVHLLIQFTIFLILIIPGLMHGEQYYVYRGNFFDQYIYLSEGITAQKFTWPQLQQMISNPMNDVYKFGIDLLIKDRPPVTLVYALLLTGGKGSMFFAAYLYHCMFMSMIFAPMFEMVKHITKKTWAAGIIAVGYIFGFYGQIQFDINAWSHISTIALFIANAYIVMLFFEDAYTNSLDNKKVEKYVCNVKLLIIMNIIMLGGAIYYVENWSIQYALSCISILLICIIKKYRVTLKQIGAMISVPLVSLAISFVACPQVITFLQYQIASSIGGKVDYGNYWYNWLFGFWNIENIPRLAKIPAVFASLFGASIYVPAWNKGRLIVLAWTAVFILIVLLLAISILVRISMAFKNTENIGEQFISVWFIVCLVMGLALFYKAGHYGFIKYVLYVSPYLWIIATLPITNIIGLVVDRKTGAVRTIMCVSAVTILLSAVAMMGLRVMDTVKNDKCYGYSNAYPSDQDPGLKNSHVFNFDVNKVGDAEVVQIEEEFPFYLYYMKLSLLYADKEYYSSENHVHYVNDDIEMEKPDKIDVLVTLYENEDGMLEPVYK